MQGYIHNIEEATLANTDYRRVLYTGAHLQLVLQCLEPGVEIGEEVHDDRDQFLRFESGTGKVMIDGQESVVEDGSAVVVPAGARHNVWNTGQEPLKLYSLYAKPEHKDGLVQATKADETEEHWEGETSE